MPEVKNVRDYYDKTAADWAKKWYADDSMLPLSQAFTRSLLFVVRDGVGRQDKSSDVIVDGERYDRAFYAYTLKELAHQSEGIFAFEHEMPDAEPSVWRNYIFVKP